MFVRFRHVGSRLVADLAQSRYVGGRVISDHIGRLGSVALPIAARDRVRLWSELDDRFRGHRRLATVSPEDRRRALALLHQRIPRPTPAEIKQILERLRQWAA